MLNKGTTKNRVMMDYLRQLFWYSAAYNFLHKVFHIPGKLNVWPDHISRLHQEEYLVAFGQFELSSFGPNALTSLVIFLYEIVCLYFLCILLKAMVVLMLNTPAFFRRSKFDCQSLC